MSNFASNDNMTALFTAAGEKIGERAKIFPETKAEWDALPLSEKIKYDYVAFAGDSQSGIVDDVPTEDSENLVKSGGVYDSLATKANLTQISNPNLLDNPWFTVNQRGQSSYAGSTARVYTFDRWRISAYSPDITVTDNNDGTITIANTGSTDNLQFAQLLESDLLISGKTYTLTCDVVAYTGSVRMLFAGDVSPYPTIINKLVDKTGYVSGKGVYDGTSNTYKVTFSMYANSSITIRAVKLELGSVSTLAMDTAPNYATELLKCQRYFQNIKNTLGNVGTIGIAYGVSGTSSRCPYFLPQHFRSSPTISLIGSAMLTPLGSGSAITVTSIMNYGLIDTSLNLRVDVASGLTSGTPYSLQLSNGSSIELSADL